MLEQLEKKRQELGMNHSQFASYLGVSPQLYHWYCKGGKRSFLIEDAGKIALVDAPCRMPMVDTDEFLRRWGMSNEILQQSAYPHSISKNGKPNLLKRIMRWFR